MHFTRLHQDLLDSPKIGRLPLEAVGFWALCLAHAGRRNPRGTLPDDADALAFALHRDPSDVARLLKVLIDARLIDETEDGLVMHDWDKHQPNDSSAERTRRYRQAKAEKNKASDEPNDADVTPSRDACDASQPSHRHCDDVTVRGEERRREENSPPSPPQGDPLPDTVPVQVFRPEDDDVREDTGPRGKNSAAEVRQTEWLAHDRFPDHPVVADKVPGWLDAHEATRVQAAIEETARAGARKPAPYVESLLNDRTFPRRRPQPARASPPGYYPKLTDEEIAAQTAKLKERLANGTR